MKHLYEHEHAHCLYFDKGFKPVIEIKEISQGEVLNKHPKLGKVLFLLEGNINYSFGFFKNCTMSDGQMLFIPPDYHFTFEVRKKTHMVIIRLQQNIQFCESYNLTNLIHQTVGVDTIRSGLKRTKEEPFILSMNKAIEIYIDSLIQFINKGPRCKAYFEIKIKELFYLYINFYPKEELAMFFRKAFNMEGSFGYFIINNYHKYKTASEIADVMGLTLSGFEKRFKKAFNTPPYKWMNEHKAKKIYHAICSEDTPLKDLSTRFAFASRSSFNDFCKRNLGATPGQIRKNALAATQEKIRKRTGNH